MFQPVSSRVSFPELEERILKLWRENDTFRRSVANRRGGPCFMLYEGPPTANGRPGIHHVLSRVFKDVIPRYKTMKGYHAPRWAGWDTHGLPVELEVERDLGLTSKKDIEEYGIEKFNAKCRESVWSYLKEWDSLTERIAFWIDLEHPYITMDNTYIESCWWALKQMWDRGLIYQGYRVTPHCPRCGTSLSSHEVALGYKDDAVDPSVYIKFRLHQPSLKDSETGDRLLDLFAGRPAYFLAWTTTPWTLPGNTSLAVAAAAEYAVVEIEDGFLILASARLPYAGLDEAPVRAKVKGSDLVGLRYEPLYNPYDYGVPVAKTSAGPASGGTPAPPAAEPFTYPVIATDFVSMDDGTGIVHVAPAFGEVDYDAGVEFGLDFVQPVDLQGKMTGTYPFAGKFVKDADKDVMDDLKSRGLLYRRETITHTYPFCWRCSTPLLYYAKQSWYIRTTAVKDRLIAGNDEINWYPEHIKYGRFGDWLKNNVDWAFSRERYWGTPLPVWRCESCGQHECAGSVQELRDKPGFSGFREPLDLHRPFVDEVTYACPRCGSRMRRLTEVIDCWFDSGAMPVAQLHYPFDNTAMFDDGRFPADYICEAVDQTRGWFYSLHAISTLLFDRPCFRNVICLGLILDARGEKMSKSRGNVVEPAAVIDKYGADALRWYCISSAPPGNVRRFSDKQVAEIARRFFLTLWNVYSFFVTYANIDRYVPGPAPAASGVELDRWIISELHELIAGVDAGLEGYEPTDAARRIEAFVDFLSNWYVRRSRRRFWKSENDADKAAAYNTLYECLVTLSKLVAPFAPFLAEELYQNLVRSVSPGAPHSVHLSDFPVADPGRIDAALSADVRLVMRVSSLGRAARSQAGIKVRQPLARLMVKVGSAQRDALKRLESQVLEEVNVKKLEMVDSLPEPGTDRVVCEEGGVTLMLDAAITTELKAEGITRELVHRLQTMRRSAGFDIADYIVTHYQGDAGIDAVIEQFAAYIKQETLSRELVAGIPGEGFYTETHALDGQRVLLGVRKLE